MWPFQGSTIDFIGQLIGNDPILQARFVDQFFFGPAVRSNEYYHIGKYKFHLIGMCAHFAVLAMHNFFFQQNI